MRLKTLQESALSQQELLNGENNGCIEKHIHNPNAPLTEEMLRELKVLASMSGDEINFSDIPKLSDKELEEFVRGPWTPRIPRVLTLNIDDEVAEWLEVAAKKDAYAINLLLKREAQRWKRMNANSESALDKAS